jgi:hypothetical protein
MYAYPRKAEKPKSTTTLKRRYAALKGWIKRKKIDLLNGPRSDADFVEYQGRYMRTRAWYVSPSGRDDAELVRKFLEVKAKLDNLGAL